MEDDKRFILLKQAARVELAARLLEEAAKSLRDMPGYNHMAESVTREALRRTEMAIDRIVGLLD